MTSSPGAGLSIGYPDRGVMESEDRVLAGTSRPKMPAGSRVLSRYICPTRPAPPLSRPMAFWDQRQDYPVSTTVSTNVVRWVISIGSSPFSTARKTPEIEESLSLLVTKWMNFDIFCDER